MLAGQGLKCLVVHVQVGPEASDSLKMFFFRIDFEVFVHLYFESKGLKSLRVYDNEFDVFAHRCLEF